MKNIKAITLFLVIYNISAIAFGQSHLVYPKDSSVFNQSEVQLEWNQFTGASSYHLQIADDPNFNNLIVDNSNLTSLSFLAQNLTSNAHYYWRVKPSNSNWSNAYTFTLVDFRTWPELEFMLDPDSVILDMNGKVEQWTDLSGNGHHFTQSIETKRPIPITNHEINFKNVINFTPSSSNYLEGVNLSNLNEGEIFSIVKKNTFPTSNLSYSTIWRFGTANGIDVYPHTNTQVYSGFGRSIRFENFYVPDSLEMSRPHILNISSGSEFIFRHNHNIKTISSNGLASFTNEAILGQGRSNLNYYFDGSFGQTLLFNTVLTDSLRNLVNKQIQHKYAPPINLGRDLVYSLCDSVLHAGKYFTSYLWSDGSTEDSLIPTQSGTYWVEVEDIFGNISSDTIEVKIKNFEYPINTTFCFGDSIIWDTGLDTTNFTFLWSNGSTSDTLKIDSSGDIHVEVIDNYGCTFYSDTLTFIRDDFEMTATLGPDTNLCSGNSIGLTSGANNVTSYLWNTTEVTPTIEINTTGTYSIIAENANGCIAKDTIDVTILGDAPIVQMQIPAEVCLGDTFNFQDQSTTTDGSTIIDWEWAFANNDTLTIANGTQVYDTSGFFPVHLTVETSAGCFNDISDTIQVRSLPILTYATSNQCEDEEIQFNGGQMSAVTIDNWEWNFDDPASGVDNIANGQNPVHTFTGYGDYEVMLIGTDVFGCVDTLVQTKTIEPTPVADFTFTEVCETQTVHFQNTSTVAQPSTISNNQWSFGDGTQSNQSNPQKPYSLYGTYTVGLTTTANNGCSNNVSKSIKIHATPQIQFTIDQNCAGLETSFTDASFVPDGSVAKVDWKFNSQSAISGFNITNNFANSGTYTLEQIVKSGFGCMNTKISSVTINPYLNADFTYTPKAFITGYPIAFESTSSGESEYLWSFGNIANSTQADTSIIFEDSLIGTEQTVKLRVGNQWDCSDSMSIKRLVMEQRTDLEISQLFSQDINGFLTIGVRLKNKGTTPITEIDLVLNSPSTGFIKETWKGMLQADEEEIYIFSTSPSAQVTVEDSLQNFLCIEGTIAQPAQFIEEDFSNNEVCKTMSENQTVIVFPYPNPVKEQLTVKVVMPKNGVIALSVYDSFGKLIHVITEKQELEKGLNVFVLETGAWSNGRYTIVYDGDGSVPSVGFVKI